MSDIAIKFENISKQYRLGTIGTGTLSHDLNRWWNMNIRGKEDPNLMIGQINDRSASATEDYVWALKEINFEVKQGEVLGIIGKNGAGKSTLLKILSRVTTPTTGRIIAYGRIASLLEVGTGFHPEMTGRENIYMNGSIMGMRKAEITRKLDEIVDFAGVEKYIDTPTKRYSSGMTVRLGFAIAAHLEPEILVVDEVLAVGDAEFQKKAIGKMQDVSKGDGRTVLFVSHNMASVKSLCTKGLLLENGEIKQIGNVDAIVSKYLGGEGNSHNYRKLNFSNQGFSFIEAGIKNTGYDFSEPIVRNEEILIEFNYINNSSLENIYFLLKFKDDEGRYLITTSSSHLKNFIKEGKGIAVMKVPSGFFNEGTFFLDIAVMSKNDKGYSEIFREADVLAMQVLPEAKPFGTWMGKELGSIRHKFDWMS